MKLIEEQLSFIKGFDNYAYEGDNNIYYYAFQFIQQYKEALEGLNVNSTELRDLIQSHFENVDQEVQDNVTPEDEYEFRAHGEWVELVIDKIFLGYRGYKYSMNEHENDFYDRNEQEQILIEMSEQRSRELEEGDRIDRDSTFIY